jgi:hypothetical protein
VLGVDFDGVLHAYDQWHGLDVVDGRPVPGAMEFLARASDCMRVAVYSRRSGSPIGTTAMKEWLEREAKVTPGWQSWLPLVEWWTEKPPARVFLDDRAWTFQGEWPAIDKLMAFQPWNRR